MLMPEYIRSYRVIQVPHQSMQTQLSYRCAGQTDRPTDGFIDSRFDDFCLEEI